MVARHQGDEKLARRAEAVAARTFELSQLLVDVLGVEDVGAFYPHRVSDHRDLPLDADAARRRPPGVPAAQCPGARSGGAAGRRSRRRFRGTFALKNYDTSTAMLADKMRNILDTQAEVCSAGDSSCLMHIGGGLSRLRAGVRTVHLAEILASRREEA